MSIPENRTLRGAVIDYTSDRKLPLNECKIYFLPVQAGEGTPSPENVREISGWDSVTLNVNPRLPSEYQEVEYIESTGTQYIDLNFGFHPNDKIIAEFSIDITQNIDKYIVSPNVWNTNNNRFAMGVHNYGKYTAGYGYSATSGTMLTPLTINDGNIHKWIYNNRNFSIPELECSKDVSQITFVSETVNLRLFYGYNSNTKGKIKSYHHIKQNGTEINLIPCYRISDHTPGMFDLVTNQFYTNSGTGNFILGPEVGITIDFPKTIYGGYVDLIRGEIVEDYIAMNENGWVQFRQNNGYIAYRENPQRGTTKNKSWYSNIIGNYGSFTSTSMNKNIIQKETVGGDICLALDENVDITTLQLIVSITTPNTYSINPQDLHLLRGANRFSSNLNGDIEISFAAEEYPQLSGNIVTFNSPVVGKQFEECKVYFTPKQDLHGYSKPWVGGSGKNKLNPSTLMIGKTYNLDGILQDDESRSVTEKIRVDASKSVYVTYTCSDSGARIIFLQWDSEGNLLSRVATIYDNPYTVTLDPNCYEIAVSFYANSNPYAITKWSNYMISQDTTSYEPYENICPIEGWDGITVTACGKNLIDENFLRNGNNYKNAGNYGYYYTDWIYLTPNTKYRFTWSDFDNDKIIDKNCNLYVANAGEYIINNGEYRQYTSGFTTGSDAKIRFGIYRTSFSPYSSRQELLDAIFDNGHLQLELGSTSTTYEPYQGTTQTITFPQTIYGGYVDLVNGEIVETHKARDIGDVLWSYSWGCFVCSYADMKIHISAKTLMSENYKVLTNTTAGDFSRDVIVPDKSILGRLNYKHIGIKDKSYSTIADFVTANNGRIFVYPLETPQRYSLDIDTLTTLKNTNTLFSNANGNITVRAIGNVPAPIHSMDFVRRENAAAPHIESKTGNYLTFNTDMELPLASGRVYFSPKQDLHGYSKPWVGGAGKNLTPPLFDGTFWTSGWFDVTGTVKDNAAYKMCDYKEVIPNQDYVFSSSNVCWKGIGFYDEEYNPINFTERNLAEITLTSPSNTKYYRVYISNTGENVQLEKGSTATTYEPYENICPIEGWDEITIDLCGINFASKDNGVVGRGSMWGGTKGAYGNIGINNKNAMFLFRIPKGQTFKISCLNSDEYWVSRIIATQYDTVDWSTYTKSFIGYRNYVYYYNVGSRLTTSRISPPEEADALLVEFRMIEDNIVMTQELFGNLQISCVLSNYEPNTETYNGTSITIPFPKTIYGGYVDLVSGEVVEEWAKTAFGDDWTFTSSANRIFGKSMPTRKITVSGSNSDLVCNKYPTDITRPIAQAASMLDKVITARSTYNTVMIKDSTYETVDSFETANSDGEFAYVLATPNTYPLTMQPITTLSGTNNFWTNSNGDVQISYYRHSDDSYQYINAQAIASNNNYLLVTDDGFVIGTEENVTVY